jgi:sugar lactone lactonase YvrE
VYVADTNNNTIRKITAAGVASTLAGTAGMSGSTDNTGSAARFNGPFDLALDSAGNLFVSDTGNNTIRKVTPAGIVTTVAGTAGTSGSTDANGTAALFNGPQGIAVDASGNVYVVDSKNNTIRKIAPTGDVTTLAGTAGVTGSADNAGSAAQFNEPQGLTLNIDGNLYVADFGNNTVRQVTPAGVVTTFAGAAGPGSSTDGVGSAARFQGPTGITADSAGNLYVTDFNNFEIRKIDPTAAVTTLAGTTYSEGVVLGPLPGILNAPARIAVVPAPKLEFAVSDNHENSILIITFP